MSGDNGGNGVDRRQMLARLGLGAGVFLAWSAPPISAAARAEAGGAPKKRWGYLIDTSRCIGCTSCMRACRAENDVPDGYVRTWVERYRIAENGDVTIDAPTGPEYNYPDREGKVEKGFYVPKLCNHCESSVCEQVCPVGATYLTPDGVVLVDPDYCVGCGYCVQACPYGCRFINPTTHVADKCTLCYHRITKGLQPACVESCPTGARIFGDLEDPDSTISRRIRLISTRVLKPELGTRPKCRYIGLDREVI